MWLNIMLILAGLILGVASLKTLPAIGDALANISKTLAGFQVVIGVAVLMFGVHNLLQLKGLVGPLLGIMDGLVLLAALLPQIPKIGDDLESFAKKLIPFEAFLGVLSVVWGIYWIVW